MAEFYTQNCGLNFVEAAVPAGLGADVARGLAVIAEGAQARVESRGIRDNHAAIAGGAEIFCGIKTDASDVSKRAGATTLVGGADGLGVVFNEGNVVFLSDFAKGIHVCGETVKMDGDDGFGARRDTSADIGDVEIECGAVDVGENWFCAERADGAAGGDECERGEKDFVSRVHVAGAEREDERVGATGDSDAVCDSAKSREFFFKRETFLAQDELLRCENAVHGGANFGADGGVLAGEVELVDGIGRRDGRCGCVHSQLLFSIKGVDELRSEIRGAGQRVLKSESAMVPAWMNRFESNAILSATIPAPKHSKFNRKSANLNLNSIPGNL